MGYIFSADNMNAFMNKLSEQYIIFAPKVFEGGGTFSDTDMVRYGEVKDVDEIVFDRKSDYSFKEVLLPLSQTLFFFTEDSVKEANPPKKGAVIFLRSCDLHAVTRIDEIYLKNGSEDYYYKQFRDNAKFIVMGCKESYENCFCVDMGTNKIDTYDAYIELTENSFIMDNKNEEWNDLFQQNCDQKTDVKPSFVNETQVRVSIPDGITTDVFNANMWDEYDTRCISCGRCNFVCPTCTCFTMQDIFYEDNGKAGERRRVWASCMVDGYTDVAGGGAYRKKNGQRMRFKVLHKVYDYKKRNGYHMCIGCGRCDDVCPEYISYSNCINRLPEALKEVSTNE